MERKFTDDPRDAEIVDNVLRHMRHSLQMLASPAQAQLSHFPTGWIVLTDELALDSMCGMCEFIPIGNSQ